MIELIRKIVINSGGSIILSMIALILMLGLIVLLLLWLFGVTKKIKEEEKKPAIFCLIVFVIQVIQIVVGMIEYL